MSTDVIREAALYLEYFLKGMSECNVIGSYTVQFLEMRGLNDKINTSLATNLIQLIENMKNLLIKLDDSVLPVCDAKVQTDLPQCSFCNCHTTLSEPLDRLSLPERGKQLESQVKSCETAEFSNFLSTTGPLIQLKQELPCVSDSATPCSSQCDSVEMEVSEAALKELETKDVTKIKENRIGPETPLEKCVLPGTLRAALGENMDIEREGEHGEILLDHLGNADGSQSDGLMYSVYTMNSCGALQLVSRVLSKSTTTKDSVEEPVERAMIEIKDETGSDPHLMQNQNGELQIVTSNQEEMVVAPDIPVFEGKTVLKISGKCSSSPKILQTKNVPHSTSGSTILTDIVKMGPEDLGATTWCGICEKEFPSAGSLKAHLSRIHSQVKWCHTCTKTISSEEEMCDHVRDCHADLTFVCAICGQSLRTNAAFQRHMDIHKGYRGSACEICGQTFSRTEYCREHKRIHTGEKPYKCETCEKTFSRSSNLYAHMRIHNTESQRHTCNICLKSFARADKLKDHMIRHLQIKRYACRLCPKAYNEKRDLTKHLEKMHSGHNDNDT